MESDTCPSIEKVTDEKKSSELYEIEGAEVEAAVSLLEFCANLGEHTPTVGKNYNNL